MAFHFQPQADSSDDEQVDLSAWKAGSKSKAQNAPVAQLDGAADDGENDAVGMPRFSANGRSSPSARDVDVSVEEGEEEDVIEIPDVPGIPVEEEEVVGASSDVEEVGQDDQVSQPRAPLEHSPAPSESRKRKRQQAIETFVSPSFTSINRRAAPPRTDSEAETSKPAHSRTRRSARGAEAKSRLVPVLPRTVPDDLDSDVEDFTHGRDIVRMVKKEITDRDGDVTYKVEFVDRHVEEVC